MNNEKPISGDTDSAYHEAFGQATNETEFSQCAEHIIRGLGFTFYSIIRLDSNDFANNDLNTFPSCAWRKRCDEAYLVDEVIIQNAIAGKEPFYLSSIINYYANAPFSCNTKKSFEHIYRRYKSHRIFDVYHLPIHETYLLSVAAQGVAPLKFRELSAPQTLTLGLITESIIEVIESRFPDIVPVAKPVVLNTKPLQVLNELANSDLTIGQIADKLCISRATANHHLERVRHQFGVKTNGAAIRKAILQGLIRYCG